VATTYGTYALALVVFTVVWGMLSWMFAFLSQTSTAVAVAAANALNATQGPYTGSASQAMTVSQWLFSLLANPLALAALIAIGLLLSAYAARR